MIGFTFGNIFLIFNNDIFDSILNNLFLDLEIECLTKENKFRFVDSFMDNYMFYLEEYLDWILENK